MGEAPTMRAFISIQAHAMDGVFFRGFDNARFPSRIFGGGGSGNSRYQPEPRISAESWKALRTLTLEISRASASVARIAPLPSHDMFDQTQEAL